MDEELNHYGTPHHSGRYPWGSGDDPQQRNKSFLGQVDDLKKKGLTEVQIAEGLGMTTSQLRARKSIAKSELRKADYSEALRLRDKGMSNVAIGERMGIAESSVRALLNPAIKERSDIAINTANMLKSHIDRKDYIDVGVGVERHLNISRTKLKTAIELLKEEGYTIHYIPVEQLGTGKKTSTMVIAKPDTPYAEVFKNKDKIKMISDHSEDGGRSFLGLEPINSISSDRVHIRYHEDGGSEKDGVIELRRGVDELSLGSAKYAQVRIGVDGSHYMKGMAMYTDDIPKGVDVIYNTNKSKGTAKEKVFKEMKADKDGQLDPDNPFGAVVRQQHFITEKGKKTQGSSEMLRLKQNGLSYEQIAKKMNVSEDLVKECVNVKALNIVNEEGDWGKWSRTLSSQMLSKQAPALAKKQLGLAYDIRQEEYDGIMKLNNPVIKKKLLDSFANDCDSASVHLKAAALPRQGAHAILPFTTMKETEIYAPNYNNGERVVLIRYPHGGIFEIPELTVNNKHPEAKKVMGGAKDAVGINHKVAERLSGADFDGDTVLVIPNPPNVNIKTSARLKGLKDFDPKISYKPYDGMQTIDGGIYNEKTGKVDYGGNSPRTRTKQMKMGDVSNLITDMTIRGANSDELIRAVRHSMVVIDSEKHHLDYKRSYIENGIAALKKRYQGGERRGASTLISKASSDKRVDHREAGKKVIDPETGKSKRVYVDPVSGKKLYEYTGQTYTDAKGNIIRRTVSSSKMAETDDAFTLSSGTPMETVYAIHANKLKSLANQARKDSISQPPIYQNKSAKEAYKNEVASLKAHLNIALKNAPLERHAQLIANTIVKTKRDANPGMDASELKKIKGQALAEARTRLGAKKQRIDITDKEWEAIQAGAISQNLLTQILNNTDLDRVKALATPRSATVLAPAKVKKAKAMLELGYTQSEVAASLGISTSVLLKATE